MPKIRQNPVDRTYSRAKNGEHLSIRNPNPIAKLPQKTLREFDDI